MLLVAKDSFGELMMLLVTENSRVLKTFWMVKIFPIINDIVIDFLFLKTLQTW